MAGDWIPMRLDLSEDPAVIEMAERLGVREETIVGYCHKFWSWVSRQCHQATVTGVTLVSLGRILNLPGFPELMVDVGWLEYHEIGGKPTITIPKFDRYLSNGAKNRLRNTRNQAKKRYAPDVTEMSPVSGDKTVTREQERREEKRTKKRSSSPEGDRSGITGNGRNRETYSPGFELFWTAFPKQRKSKKRLTWQAWERALRRVNCEGDPEQYLIQRARDFAKSWKGRSQYADGPAPWLNGNAWEDDPSAWADPSGSEVQTTVDRQRQRDPVVARNMLIKRIMTDRGCSVEEAEKIADSVAAE